MIVLGMMSGTSGDGIDTAIVEIFGIPPTVEWRLLHHDHLSFPQDVRNEIFACFRPETSSVDRLCKLNFALSEVYANAALKSIHHAGLTTDQIDLIGNHGQTLWHIPADHPNASTLQMGDPSVIAERTSIAVVSNFRTADMAAGGNGAPLASFADWMLFRSPNKVRAAQNIGGIGNVTWLPKSGDNTHQAVAFDTGPGNMLMDYAANLLSNGELTYDKDAQLASQGKVQEDFLAEILQDPYFSQKPPKTTGREYFGVQYGEKLKKRAEELGISGYDFIATLTALTAQSIANAYHEFLPIFPDEVIVSGGGAFNPLLMEMLRKKLAPAKVFPIDELGLLSDAKEAAAFALMAYETWYKRPGNIPSATGARHPVIMGSITWAPPKKQTIDEEVVTEQANPRSGQIDEMSTLGMLQTINDEDRKVAEAVGKELPQIARAVDEISERMASGGRLIYIGAGTSGRLGVLDASEIPPTYGTSPDLVLGRIAGGMTALVNAVEGAEDDPNGGKKDIEELKVGKNDSVVGIAASGNTPYVIGGLDEAHARGALTVALACSKQARIAIHADIAILPVPGPEIISGSTRMKSGTAQKLVLNMISTGVMIKQGKTYGNLMVDLHASNNKLILRQIRIVSASCGIPEAEAEALLGRCDGNVKVAIVSYLKGVPPETAALLLEQNGGFVKKALQEENQTEDPENSPESDIL